MLFFLYLPEVVAFLQFFLVSTQEMPFGALLVLAQFALFALVAIAHPVALVRTVMRWWPLLLVQILAVASAAWSPLPAETARYALQYLYTAMLGVLLAHVLTPRRFLIVLLVALFVFCILCIVYGRQGPSFNHMVLVGLTGSKNQLAYEAQLLMIAAIAVFMLRDISAPLRWVALISLPLSAYLLVETESSTAMVMAGLGGVALVGLAICHRLTPGGRVAALAGAVVVMLPLLALLPEITGAINHFVFDTLNKDPTLSGRTALWARADDLIARRPLLGYGYQAIWMGDSTETIALRRLTGIFDSRVFHFHHQFRQIAIDTGMVGLLSFIGLLGIVGFASLRKFVLQPSIETTFFFLVFMLMVARGFVDIIISPFSIHTLIFYAACVYALRQASETARWEHATAPPHWIQRAALSRLR
jgi:exopolysaccharide production protein ExoQ